MSSDSGPEGCTTDLYMTINFGAHHIEPKKYSGCLNPSKFGNTAYAYAYVFGYIIFGTNGNATNGTAKTYKSISYKHYFTIVFAIIALYMHIIPHLRLSGISNS
ncbi:Uncharacterised protein [uncultured archaeon]|nr:Uncharacterised protein [uncultured archaeon]